jgi:hypothetical protein
MLGFPGAILLIHLNKRICLAVILWVTVMAAIPTRGQVSGAVNAPSIEKMEQLLLLPGVVVEKVGKNSVAEKAGLREGDILLRWSRGEAKGIIDTPTDLWGIELEQSARGSVELQGTRRGKPVSWTLNAEDWKFNGRLHFSSILLPEYLQATELLRAGRSKEADEHWRMVALRLPALSPARSSLFLEAASAIAESSDWQQSEQAYSEALENASGKPLYETSVYWQWALSEWHHNNLKTAKQLCDKAIQAAKPESSFALTTALLLVGCMSITVEKGDIDDSESYARSSRKLWDKLALNSDGNLANIISLGTLASERGDLALAEHYYRDGLAKWTKSNSPFMLADAFWGLGWALRLRGITSVLSSTIARVC